MQAVLFVSGLWHLNIYVINFYRESILQQVSWKKKIQHFLMVLTQISIYGVVCSICFANLIIHQQKAKPKNNGMKILDNQGVII
jgi:hypothetical protein